MRRVVVAITVLAALAPVPSGAATRPGVATEIRNLSTFWVPEPDGAKRLPATIAYEGRVSSVAGVADAYERDVYGPTRLIRLAELSADVDPLTNTSFVVRGRTTAIKARLLNDAGVDFQVAGLSPFGTQARFGQGAVHDLYFWGGAAAGSQAANGNYDEAMVINTAGDELFPARAPSGREGALEWQRTQMLREAESRAFDPTINGFLSTTLVSAVDAPLLRVVGGDLTGKAEAEPLDLHLPQDVTTLGALSIYPTGLPGVKMGLSFRFPDSGVRDFHRAFVDVVAEPDELWPESRTVGTAHEWVYRPLVLSYGIRRSPGTAASASFEAPVDAGATVQSVSVDGTVRTIGPVESAGVVRVDNVEGRQELTFVAAPERTRAHRRPATARGRQRTASAGARIESPEAGTLIPAGAVSATLVAREGVPTLADITAPLRDYGDMAFPSISVDGATHPLTEARLVSPLQITPIPFGNGGGGGFRGSGFVVGALVQVGDVMAELATVVKATSLYEQVDVYVIDVHSTEANGHAVDVVWYSKPPADRFTANTLDVPVEAVTHLEFNGDVVAENRPNIEALDTSSSSLLRYFVIAPTTFWQTEPNGARSIVALLADHGSFQWDPVSGVNGEALEGSVALYERIHVEGMPPAAIVPAGWLSVFEP